VHVFASLSELIPRQDIVMPKLDGVSATSMIRKFDPQTPIISMTSNSRPNEIMTYYSSGSSSTVALFQCFPNIHTGMNDILPKPFTKEGLLDMLEVRVLVPLLTRPANHTLSRNI
jgi:osomolarity two-component system response regulator SKN7